MKKIICILLLVQLFACDNRLYIIEPIEEEFEDHPEKTNPPIIQVDSSLVIIEDTIKISF